MNRREALTKITAALTGAALPAGAAWVLPVPIAKGLATAPLPYMSIVAAKFSRPIATGKATAIIKIESIRLVSHVPDGWHEIGVVEYDDPALAKELQESFSKTFPGGATI